MANFGFLVFFFLHIMSVCKLGCSVKREGITFSGDPRWPLVGSYLHETPPAFKISF